MRLLWASEAWTDYLHWQANDPWMLLRVNELLREAMRQPFGGIGKPEPLKGAWSGWWSRRIDREHRLVYRVVGKGAEQHIEVAQCRFHY
ncbi:MAG TPA: Txe/YoeB family addiction module toxin [Kiloniellales bacterium]|nr:Txe/YoeB family addiction module toxin [Kiloniellales bacterium]